MKIHHLKKREISIFRGQKSLEIGFSVLFENYQWESTVADWNHRQTGLVDCISLENRNTSQAKWCNVVIRPKIIVRRHWSKYLRLIDSKIIEFQRQFIIAKFISMYNIPKNSKKLIYVIKKKYFDMLKIKKQVWRYIFIYFYDTMKNHNTSSTLKLLFCKN